VRRAAARHDHYYVVCVCVCVCAVADPRGRVSPKSPTVIFSVCCFGLWKDCYVSFGGRWGTVMKYDEIVTLLKCED
jgi:hypothetical protein